MRKKTIMVVFALVVSMSLSISVFGSSNVLVEKNGNSFKYYGNSSKDQESKVLSRQEFEQPPQKSIDIEKLKKEILNNLNKDPEKNAEIIANIDKVIKEVEKSMLHDSSSKNESSNESPDVTPYFGVPFHDYWSVEPYQTSETYWVTYSTAWIGVDSYNSSLGATSTHTQSTTVSRSLGFNGSSKIKSAASEFGLQITGSYTASSTATFSVGYTVPPWTIVATRPYIYWTERNYEGEHTTLYYNPLANPTIIVRSNWHSATDSFDTLRATQLWDAVNYSQTYSTPPSPPEGWEW